MQTEELIKQISREDFDLKYFSQVVLEDKNLRDEVVHQMMTHRHIMVYYHCFYVIEKACSENPEVFYMYRGEFASLLNHANSYHRDFGLVLIGLLTKVDKQHYIDGLIPEYLTHASDVKLLTARFCVQNCVRIIQFRPDLSSKILKSIVDQDKTSPYRESQTSLLKVDILDLMEHLFDDQLPDPQYAKWIISASTCCSPKARAKAKELIKKYHLIN